ncbi:hypothetical protein D3C87_1615320 [compost metagenome]
MPGRDDIIFFNDHSIPFEMSIPSDKSIGVLHINMVPGSTTRGRFHIAIIEVFLDINHDSVRGCTRCPTAIIHRTKIGKIDIYSFMTVVSFGFGARVAFIVFEARSGI